MVLRNGAMILPLYSTYRFPSAVKAPKKPGATPSIRRSGANGPPNQAGPT